TLSTSGGGTYSWSDGTTGTSITVSPATPSSYSVTVTNGSCSGTASVQVNVTSNPAPTITGNNSVCPGTSTTLTATIAAGSGTPSYMYNWSDGSTTVSATVSPSSPTNYTVTITDANGCTGVTTVNVTITPPPNPTIGGTTAICTGGSTTLTATAGGTYAWNTGSTTAAITVSPATNTTYTVLVTTGCTASASVVVTVQSGLTPTITGTTMICNGSSTTLTANSGGTYVWNDGSTNASLTVSPGSPTSYSVTVTSGLCSGTASVQVMVTPNPAPTVSGNTICSGEGTTITANAGGTYNWSTGQTTASITISPSVTTTYTVVVTNTGCTGSATAEVRVNQTPAPSISNPATICSGQSTVLTTNGTVGPYAWSNGATTSSITVTPASSITYSVSVTQNGCTGTAEQTITVIPPVVASIQGNSICIGDNVTLTGSGGTSYYWSPGGDTTKSIVEIPLVTTTYTLITAVGNCPDTATYEVKVDSLPVPMASGNTTINYGQSTKLTSSGGGIYQWIPSTGLNCANCPNPTASPTASTQYCVMIKNTAGCIDSACVTVLVELKCGFEGELFVPNGFSPNNDGQNDVLYVRGLGITGMYWAIYDRWGEKVFETTDFRQGWDGKYKGKDLDPAVFVYYLEVICITGDQIKQKGNVAIIK
ncbi:MAG: gliding motility-associated C-terminal domain-containing protein, partial [Bacteroidota bacterium]